MGLVLLASVFGMVLLSVATLLAVDWLMNRFHDEGNAEK